MNERQHLALFPSARVVHLLCLTLAVCLTGCRHKTLRQVLPVGVLAPVDLEPTEPLDPAPEVAEVPLPELPPLEPPAPPRPTIRRRPATKEEGQTPAQTAGGDEPMLLAIGSLTSGDDGAPETLQQARDLIASIERRISALPAKIADAQKRQLKQIKNFLDQAEKALNSGDTVGANNLASKARLLMDDLEKK